MRVRRAAFGAFGVNILSSVLTLGLHVLMTRVLGINEYGTYIYLFTWVVVLSLIAKLGFDTALVRYLPVYRSAEDWPHLRGVMRRAMQLSLVVAVVLALAAFVTGLQLNELLDSASPVLLAVSAMVLLALTATHLVQAGLRGLQMVPRNEMPDRLLRPAVMMATIAGLAFVLGHELAAVDAMVIHLVALCAGLAIGTMWLMRAWPTPGRDAAPAYRTREWLMTALPLAWASAAHLALAQIDVLMVGALMSTAEAGIYAVAARLAVFVIFALTAVNAIVAPTIAELFATGRRGDLQRILIRSAQAATLFAMFVTVAFAVVGAWVLSWFGPAFTAGYTALLVLCASHVLNALAGSVGVLLAMSGEERAIAVILTGAMVVNVALNAWLIPLHGIEGAAIATATTTILWNLLMLAYVHRRLGLNASAVRIG